MADAGGAMNTLGKVVTGLAIGTAAFLGYGWYKSRQSKQAGCSVPLSVDELNSPRGQRMMALYGECIRGGSGCTPLELQSLLVYLKELCPDNAIESAWLQATKDSLKNVVPEGSQLAAGSDPRYAPYFTAGIHVAGCGCEQCSKGGHPEAPCCEACALGKPCTGACQKRKEPQTVGRA